MDDTPQLRDSQEQIPGPRRSHRSRHVMSDEIWELHREEIYRIYMEQKNTLSQTKRMMEDIHKFRASIRKYKMKLKEWNFDKHLPATNMGIILAKDTMRATEEGKETVFFNGGQEINAERIENFKKRMNSNGVGIASPSAVTPANITYHTPHPDSDAALIDETDIDAVSPGQDVDLSQASTAATTVNHPSTKDVNEMAAHQFEQSTLAEGSSLGNPLQIGSEISTQEASILACGHKNEGNIAQAFEESLNAPNSDEFLPALKILYGLDDAHESEGRLCGEKNGYGRVEAGHINSYGTSSSKIIRAIFDLSSILESQKEYGLLPSRPLGCERPRSVEDRLSCHWCSQDYVSSFLSVLAKYKERHQWQRVFLAMAVLRGVYFEIKRWNDLMSTMSEMKKILDNGIEMNDYLTPDVLVEGIDLAGTYSVLKNFASAHSVFSSVLPKLWLLTDAKYESDVIYGYIEFGLHYKRQELWREAFDYLSLAHKGLTKSGRLREAMFLEPHLDMDLRLSHELRCLKEERIKINELEHIEMGRGNGLLKTISHSRTWKTATKDHEKKCDSETDTTSCKYGITYSVSSITGISDSVFIVP